MTRRPVAFFDLTADDYDDLDATVQAIMAAILERRTATQFTEEIEQPVTE